MGGRRRGEAPNEIDAQWIIRGDERREHCDGRNERDDSEPDE
jgi:hypothetical protein